MRSTTPRKKNFGTKPQAEVFLIIFPRIRPKPFDPSDKHQNKTKQEPDTHTAQTMKEFYSTTGTESNRTYLDFNWSDSLYEFEPRSLFNTTNRKGDDETTKNNVKFAAFGQKKPHDIVADFLPSSEVLFEMNGCSDDPLMEDVDDFDPIPAFSSNPVSSMIAASDHGAPFGATANVTAAHNHEDPVHELDLEKSSPMTDLTAVDDLQYWITSLRKTPSKESDNSSYVSADADEIGLDIMLENPFEDETPSPSTAKKVSPKTRKDRKESRSTGSKKGNKPTTHASQSDLWEEKFQELSRFIERHGHCAVPHSFKESPPLAQWVKRQRYQYKLKKDGMHSTLTDVREHALNKLGFIWDSHKAIWDERFQQLTEYREERGNCNVPTSYPDNPSLSVWVKCQRRQYKLFTKGKRSTMNPLRISKLNSIGFVWNPRNLR